MFFKLWPTGSNIGRASNSKWVRISCKIFEYFALQVDPVIEFLQLRSTPFKDSTTPFKDSAILATKLDDPPFWWKSLTPPPLNLDPVYGSRSMHILYYLKMFVIKIQLLRNQISPYQQVFYYTYLYAIHLLLLYLNPKHLNVKLKNQPKQL